MNGTGTEQEQQQVELERLGTEPTVPFRAGTELFNVRIN